MSENQNPCVFFLAPGRSRVRVPFVPGSTLDEWLDSPTVQILIGLDLKRDHVFYLNALPADDPAGIKLVRGMLIAALEKPLEDARPVVRDPHHGPMPEDIPERDSWWKNAKPYRPPTEDLNTPAKLNPVPPKKLTVNSIRNDPRYMKDDVLTEEASEIILDLLQKKDPLWGQFAASPVFVPVFRKILGPAMLQFAAQQEQKNGAAPAAEQPKATTYCDYCVGSGRVNFGIVTGERVCPKCGGKGFVA